MPFILGLLISVVNYLLLCKNTQKGVVLYCVLLVVCPVTIIGSISIFYSYLSLPFLILWYLRHKRKGVKAIKYIAPLVVLWIWELIATGFSVSIGIVDSVNYFGFIGTIRNIIILLILSKQVDLKEHFITILGAIILINCCAITLELALLQVWSYDAVINTWMSYYGTLGNTGSLEHMLELGTVGRLHGTFASSAFLGTLSVIGIGCFLMRYFERKQWSDILMMVASLYCGLGSASKRFFLGSVLIVAICILLRFFWKKRSEKSFDYKFPVFVFTVVATLSVLYSFLNEYLTLDYYLDYLIKGNISGSMDTRFGKEEGIVNSMLPYIKEYWYVGLGEVTIKNVLITDSEFYVTLFKAGIIGLLCFIFFWGRLFRSVMLLKDGYVGIVLAWSMFEFIISTEFSSNLGVLLVGFVLASVCIKRNIVVYEK